MNTKRQGNIGMTLFENGSIHLVFRKNASAMDAYVLNALKLAYGRAAYSFKTKKGATVLALPGSKELVKATEIKRKIYGEGSKRFKIWYRAKDGGNMQSVYVRAESSEAAVEYWKKEKPACANRHVFAYEQSPEFNFWD